MANKKVLHGEVDGATVVGVSVIGAMMRYASPVDYLYIVCAILSATLSALGWPAFTIINGKVIDAFVRFEMKAANQTNQTATDTAAADDDELVVSRLMSQVYLYSGTQLAVAIVYMIANYGTLYCLQMFALRQVNAIKRHYLHSILTQEIAWFETQTSGQFASQIASDFKKIENGINENFGLLITNAAAAVVQLAAGLWFGWKLSLVILALVPVIYVCTFIANKFQSRYMAREIEANSEASSVAEEAISAIRTVFAFGGQSKEKQRYERALRPAMVNGCKQALVSALDNGIKWCTQYASLALGVWYGVKLILDGEEGYTIGRVVIVFWCITGFGYNLIFATPYWEAFQAARTAAAEIFKIIERKSTIDCSSKSGKRLGVNYQTEIELRNVHFNYPSRPEVTVLDGVDIKINSGEVVALVGASGCGKSTIVQLIQRFYDPIDGEIRLDGTNIKELNVGWLREQIGVVGQEPVLFDASIEENIRLGTSTLRMDSLTREEIVQAAKQANAHEFIQNLPNGYHTYVGDRGTQLSGGQKQRIAIARALVAKPKLLLLDEATSALDLQSEQLVQVALDQASKGRTTIIVAHRLSTIKNADRIIVLDGGKVLESGTHNELMQRHSAYYSLVMAQQVIANDNNDTVNIVNLVNEQTEANKPKAVDDSHEDVEFKKSSAPHRLLQMIWRLNRVQFMVAFLAAILYGLATPTYALIFGSLVDTFGKSTDQDYLWSQTIKFVILFACLSVAIFIFNVLQIYLFGVIKSKLTLKLRVQAFESILGYDVSWFDKARNSSGALSSRLANDAADLQGLTGLRIAMLCQAISTLVSSVCIGFFFSWRMSLVALVLMPIVGVASIYASQLFSGQVRQDGETAEITGKVLIEVTNSIRTVTSLHKQTYFHNMFVSALRKHFKAVQSHVFRKAFFISISQGMTFVAYAVCYCFGGFLLSKGHLTTGDLFRITESMVFGALVVGRTAIFSSDYTKAKLAAFNIFKLIDGKPNRKVITTERSIGRQMRCQGNVSLSDIHFHYPTRPDSTVLNGLSFSARQGETVALVGTSGCGKSTTVQLLQQFYQCQQGQINIDGRNIVHLNVDFVRTQIALVSQEPTLFSQSIKENIAYGDNSRAVPLEDIVKAAQAANVHNFVSELPQGYDTPVGTKGNELSCGQKQRIAIARALVRDPPILLLDEATSSLDMASEKVVQEALDEAAKGRTCIVIAHRLNTIVNADKIVVIHNGQNVEEGTHTELLTHRGHYWQLYNSALTTLQTET